MQKKDGRNRSYSAQATVREQVVMYLKKGLGTQKEAAEIFGITIRAVNKNWSVYKKGGLRAIRNKKRGVRGGKKISGKQAAEVRRLIKDKPPEQLKLAFGLWTRAAVQQLILDRFDIELSRWQVGRYLKSWDIHHRSQYVKRLSKSPSECSSGWSKNILR